MATMPREFKIKISPEPESLAILQRFLKDLEFDVGVLAKTLRELKSDINRVKNTIGRYQEMETENG